MGQLLAIVTSQWSIVPPGIYGRMMLRSTRVKGIAITCEALNCSSFCISWYTGRPNNLYSFWVNLFVYFTYHFWTPVFQHALIAGPWIVWWCHCPRATHTALTMALQRWVESRNYPNNKFISYTSWFNIFVNFPLHFRTPVFQHGASLVYIKSLLTMPHIVPYGLGIWSRLRNWFLTHWTLGDFNYIVKVNFKLILIINVWGISCEIAHRWFSLDLTNDRSTLVQVMAWCHQALFDPMWTNFYVDIYPY